MSTNTIWKTHPATDKQLAYIQDLLSQLEKVKPDVFSVANAWWTEQNQMGHPSRGTASEVIDRLQRHINSAPKPQTTSPTSLDFNSIPDGNYAIRENGVVRFYRVKATRSGFKKVQRRASDNLLPTTPRQGVAILHQIVEFGLESSQHLFADELGRCWSCGKSLTDEVSRSYRMGPDCRQARGI